MVGLLYEAYIIPQSHPPPGNSYTVDPTLYWHTHTQKYNLEKWPILGVFMDPASLQTQKTQDEIKQVYRYFQAMA